MKRICAIFLICAFLFGGCSGDASSDIFTLPELPEEEQTLIEAVEGVLGDGFEYAEPRSGINRGAIQLADIDGDDEDEGIAFLKDVYETGKTYVYIFEKNKNVFELFDIIEGSESELYSVSYADVLGKGMYEAIFEWGNAGDEKHSVTILSHTDERMNPVLDIPIQQYALSDIDGDGLNDFIAITKKKSKMYAEIYAVAKDGLEKDVSIPLSQHGDELIRVKAGRLSADKNGVFIERKKDLGIVYDVIAHNGERFVNLFPEGELCVSYLQCSDVDDDGVTEIPKETESETAASVANRCYCWNSVKADGSMETRAFTYHSASEGWYLLMPIAWRSSVYTKRSVNRYGEVQVLFFTREPTHSDEGGYIEAQLFSIYVLTGNNRHQYATEEGRFIIAEREDTVFAAELVSESYLSTQINEEFIKSIFKNMENEWFSEILFA